MPELRRSSRPGPCSRVFATGRMGDGVRSGTVGEAAGAGERWPNPPAPSTCSIPPGSGRRAHDFPPAPFPDVPETAIHPCGVGHCADLPDCGSGSGTGCGALADPALATVPRAMRGRIPCAPGTSELNRLPVRSPSSRFPSLPRSVLGQQRETRRHPLRSRTHA